MPTRKGNYIIYGSYEEIEQLLDQFSVYHIKILLDDFKLTDDQTGQGYQVDVAGCSALGGLEISSVQYIGVKIRGFYKIIYRRKRWNFENKQNKQRLGQKNTQHLLRITLSTKSK